MSEDQGPGLQGLTPSRLSCVTCRSRKLKCDRAVPACARCSGGDNDCIYPDSRRKRVFKRKDVKELEAQLTRLEEQLDRVNNEKSWRNGVLSTDPDFQPTQVVTEDNTEEFTLASWQDKGSQSDHNGTSSGQLVDLGVSESLPPFHVIEELHEIYFRNQHHSMPILHPRRYLQAMHGPPSKRPPMCLQYIVWAAASKGHEKYDFYADIFYKRARQYATADEIQGDGDHLTLRHLQTYIIMAGFDAKCMFFPRASMNSARCVGLVHSLGLDQLDDPDAAPALASMSSKSWIEIEEHRRGFWGAFAIDSHASISTGWSSLISSNDLMTRLPASEDAFLSGQEEDAPFLEEVFQGASYSTFATTLVICHIFKTVLKHTSGRSNGQPGHLEVASFWKRHKDLDNKISRVFMFLPERFHLPDYKFDPVAAHTNLNLHASTICLHYAAVEKVDKHGQPDAIKQESLGRMRISAEEIAVIIKAISSNSMLYKKSVLCALSLYCAANVYIYIAKDDPVMGLPESDMDSFMRIFRSMEATSRDHKITRALLLQVYWDIEHSGLSSVLPLPGLVQGTGFGPELCADVFMNVRVAMIKQPIIGPTQLGRLPLGRSGDFNFQDFTKNTLEDTPGLHQTPDTSADTEDSINVGQPLDHISMPLWPQRSNDISSQMLEVTFSHENDLNDGFEFGMDGNAFVWEGA